MPGARTAIKLPFRELHVICPHCRSPLVIGTVMDTTSSAESARSAGRNSWLRTTSPGSWMVDWRSPSDRSSQCGPQSESLASRSPGYLVTTGQ